MGAEKGDKPPEKCMSMNMKHEDFIGKTVGHGCGSLHNRRYRHVGNEGKVFEALTSL